MSPGDIAELSQSSSLAFRIIGDMNQLPDRNDLYWRAMVLDQYDGKTWTSSFVNEKPVAIQNLKNGKYSFNYHYLAADPHVMWVMGLEQSRPLQQNYQLKQDGRITPVRQILQNQPIVLRWLGNAQSQEQTLYKTGFLQ